MAPLIATGTESEGAARAVLFALAALSLAWAIQINTGALAPLAILWLTLALVAAAAGLALPPTPGPLHHPAETALTGVIAAGLCFQFAQLLRVPPGIYVRRGPDATYSVGLAVAAIASACFRVVPGEQAVRRAGPPAHAAADASSAGLEYQPAVRRPDGRRGTRREPPPHSGRRSRLCEQRRDDSHRGHHAPP
jgi:hypothetical protein